MTEIIQLDARIPKKPTKAERAKSTMSSLTAAIAQEAQASFVRGGMAFADSLIAALQATDQAYTTDEMIEFIETIKANLAEESVH